jgi:hypothetical protein
MSMCTGGSLPINYAFYWDGCPAVYVLPQDYYGERLRENQLLCDGLTLPAAVQVHLGPEGPGGHRPLDRRQARENDGRCRGPLPNHEARKARALAKA